MSANRDSLSIHTTLCSLLTAMVLALTLVSFGCGRHWAGRPERPAYLRDVSDYDSKDHFKTLEGEYEADGASEEGKRAARDKYVRHGLRVLDSKYCKFLDDLIYDRKGFDSSADILAIGLDTASVLFAPATTKSILAGAAAVTTGSKVTIDKTYFYDQALPGLVHQMEADRQSVLADIMISLDKPTSSYRLDDALRDLGRYYHAGTIDGALVAIQRRAAKQQEEAETRLDAIKANNDPLALQLRGSIQMWLLDDDKTVDQKERDARLKRFKAYVAATFPILRGTDEVAWMQGATSSQLTMIMRSLGIPKKTQEEIDKFRQRIAEADEREKRTLTDREKAVLDAMSEGPPQWQAALTAVETWFAGQEPARRNAYCDALYADATRKGIDFSRTPFNPFVLSGKKRIDPAQLKEFLKALDGGNQAHKEMLAEFIAREGIQYPRS
jgi:hypothetical protein